MIDDNTAQNEMRGEPRLVAFIWEIWVGEERPFGGGSRSMFPCT